MGAHNIDFQLDGKADFSKIEKTFKKIQKEERILNGHQEGYSGDFQTVHKVENHLNKIFDTYLEAYDYCLDKAEKCYTVVAVYYKKPSSKIPKKIMKLKEKCEKAHENLNIILREVQQSFKKTKSKTISCSKCESKINRSYIKGHACPVCDASLRSTTAQKRIDNAREKINNLSKQIKNEEKKFAQKNRNIATLVAGFGAS